MRPQLFLYLLTLMSCRGNLPKTAPVYTNNKDSLASIVSKTPDTKESLNNDVVNYGDVYRSFVQLGDTVYTVLKGQRDSLLLTYIDMDTLVIIKCYRLANTQWKSIGIFKTTRAGDRFETADLNFDGVEEIILSSGPNMNGNEWKQIYVYDTIHKKMAFVGQLYGNIELNKRNKTIQQTYNGSWYMAFFESEYNWVGNRLHIMKTLVNYYPNEAIMDGPRDYSLHVNRSKTNEDNIEIWHGREPADSAVFDSLWEHFFDTK
jgi:hypothetical protein